MRPSARALLLLCLPLGAGCPILPLGGDLTGFRCESDLDCLAGYDCAGGVCVDPYVFPRRPEGDGGPGTDGGAEDAPTSIPQSVRCEEGIACPIALAVRDEDTPAALLHVEILESPGSGTVEMGPGPLGVTYTGGVGSWGEDAFRYRVRDPEGGTTEATVTVRVLGRRDCAVIRESGAGEVSGVYRLDPDGPGPAQPFFTWCDMDSAGGGWTLVLKAEGTSTTFNWASPLWTDPAPFSPESADLERVEAKLASFTEVAADEVLVRFLAPDETQSARPDIVMPLELRVPSLYAVFAGGYTVRGTAGPDAWRAGAPGGALQPYCNLEGLNLNPMPGSDRSRARIGILGNENIGRDCTTGDSRIGVGAEGSGGGTDDTIAVGTSARNNAVGGDSDAPAFAFVFVRSGPPPLFPRSCLERRLAGEGVSERALIDPDGAGPHDVIEVYCEQERWGGGWTLVGRSGNAIVPGYGWGYDLGSVQTPEEPYSMDLRSNGLPFAALAFGAHNGGYTPVGSAWIHRALPAGWLDDFDGDALLVEEPRPLQGSCQNLDNGNHMFQYIGFTSEQDGFFFRDEGNNGNNGLRAHRWELDFGDCARGGDLHQQPGMIWVR